MQNVKRKIKNAGSAAGNASWKHSNLDPELRN
jgi:hypothetical protein